MITGHHIINKHPHHTEYEALKAKSHHISLYYPTTWYIHVLFELLEPQSEWDYISRSNQYVPLKAPPHQTRAAILYKTTWTVQLAPSGGFKPQETKAWRLKFNMVTRREYRQEIVWTANKLMTSDLVIANKAFMRSAWHAGSLRAIWITNINTLCSF